MLTKLIVWSGTVGTFVARHFVTKLIFAQEVRRGHLIQKSKQNMFSNIGSFNGRSRVSRLNLVQDQVEDRSQSIAKARQAREERERAQKRRRAAQVLVRALKVFAARRQLERRAFACLCEWLKTSTVDPTSAPKVFSLAHFALKTPQKLQNNIFEVSGTPVVVHLLQWLTTFPETHSAAILQSILQHPTALCGLLQTSTRVFSSSERLAQLVARAPLDVLLQRIQFLSAHSGELGVEKTPNAFNGGAQCEELQQQQRCISGAAGFAAEWLGVLCQGVRTLEALTASERNEESCQRFATMRGGLVQSLMEALQRSRALPLQSPPALLQLLSLTFNEEEERSTTTSPLLATSEEAHRSNITSEAPISLLLIHLLVGRRAEQSDAKRAILSNDVATTTVELTTLLDGLTEFLRKELQQPRGSQMAAHPQQSSSSSLLTQGQGLCNAMRRLCQLCAVVPPTLVGSLATTLNVLFEHLSVAIVEEEVTCAAVMASAQYLFEATGGLRLLQLASPSLGAPQANQQPVSAAAYHAVTSLLSTPSTLAQILGEESDRSQMISCHSRLVSTPGALEDLTAGFIVGSGVVNLGGGPSSPLSPPSASGSGGGQWLDTKSAVLAFTNVGCPSLFLQMYSYFVDSGMFTKGLLLSSTAPTETTSSAITLTTSAKKRELARNVVLALREVVVRAHLNGCDSFQSEVIATKCCILFSKLFAINELQPFCEPKDWWCPGTFSPAMVEEHWHASLDDDEDDNDIAGDAVALNSALQLAARRSAFKHQLRKNFFAGSKKWPREVRFVAMLRNAPFLISFESRVAVFSKILHPRDEVRVPFHQRMTLQVRRGRVFEDAFLQFKRQGGAGAALRSGLNPKFDDEAGFGDGVYRDFMLCLCQEGFSPEHGLFCRTDSGFLFPNPASEAATDAEHLQRFRFLGAMVGKALFDGILLSVPFALHFRNALLGRRNTFDHLLAYDPHLHRHLSFIRDTDSNAIEDFALTFTAVLESFGVTVEVPLIANGHNVAVNGSNVALYVQLYADFRLNRENERQSKAFQMGLHDVVESTALQIFGSSELDKLFQGDSGIDVDDWEQNTVYAPADGKDAPVVGFFWQLVRNMTNSERSELLGFVTSARRAPLLGFRHMVPKFTIAVTQKSVDHLPSAATCFCQLKIPSYTTFKETRDKLLQAMDHGKTFELS